MGIEGLIKRYDVISFGVC